MLSAEQKSKIQKAFQEGNLKVRSVSPSGELHWKRVLDVQRSSIGPEAVWEAQTEEGPLVLTGGHRVFTSPTSKQEMESLGEGSLVLSVQDDRVGRLKILKSARADDRTHMYDLTAEDWHNFVLHRSRVVISNSPDRNYHFRPPAHEATINQFNQVFGFIWEDHELAEYIERSVDMIAASPPATPLRNCDDLVQCYPNWKTALLTGAANYALLALMINWIADEFGYNIGGVSLDIEKSSKYESAANNFKDLFESQLEKAKATVKIVRGLQQPRYGIGIRSSFGPYAGRGQLTPQKFIGFIFPILLTLNGLLGNIAGVC